MTYDIPALIVMMEAFFIENYDAGAHWLYETWDKADYAAFLAENVFSTEDELKALLRAQWELTLEQERNCAWGAPDESPY